MKNLTNLIVKKTIIDWKNTNDQRVRSKYGVLEGWTSIAVNLVLTILKGLLGIITGSLALTADAFHTLSDVLTSTVIVISFKVSKKPSDATHPFGHGRMEAIATLVVAILLLVAGVELLKISVNRIIHPKPFEASWLIIAVIWFTVLIKELLARFSRNLGIMIQSGALKADFWHHRTDAISSVLVIIALIGQRMGITHLDGIVGVLVSGVVAYTGWNIAREGVDDLLGKKPSHNLVDKIKREARSFSEVLDIHDLIIHQYGHLMILSFHIEVSDEHTLGHAHTLAEEVEKTINTKFNTYTTVHIDPVNTRDPELKKIRSALKEILSRRKENISFHDLRIVGESISKNVLFDLVIDPNMKDIEINLLVQELKNILPDMFHSVKGVTIEVEPRYAQ
jgi:cation diffusion facilitator family transporter